MNHELKVTILVAAIAAILATGCATIQTIAKLDLPFVETEAQLACGAVLQLAVSPADRAGVAGMIYSVADVVDSLATGQVLTPDEFNAKVTAWGIGGASQYVGVAQAIAGVWAKLYPSLQGNPQLAIQVLAKISAGCCDAAKPYVTAN